MALTITVSIRQYSWKYTNQNGYFAFGYIWKIMYMLLWLHRFNVFSIWYDNIVSFECMYTPKLKRYTQPCVVNLTYVGFIDDNNSGSQAFLRGRNHFSSMRREVCSVNCTRIFCFFMFPVTIYINNILTLLSAIQSQCLHVNRQITHSNKIFSQWFVSSQGLLVIIT